MKKKEIIETTALCFVIVACLAVVFGVVATTTINLGIRARILEYQNWKAAYLNEHEKYNALVGEVIRWSLHSPEVQEIERLLDERDAAREKENALGATQEDENDPESVKPKGGRVVSIPSALMQAPDVLDDLLKEPEEPL